MAKADVWTCVHDERKALAADLGQLAPAQWDAPSLCNEWSVRDVVAHMTATANINGPSFFAKWLAAGFSLRRMQTKDIATERGASADETLSRFEAVTNSTKHPPGPVDTMLGETIVHCEDIRRPLGIPHDYPTDEVVRVADFFKSSNLIIGTKRRIAGLGLRATDTNWSHGEGPEVSGPVLALLMAMTGRKAPTVQLSGDGVPILRSRP